MNISLLVKKLDEIENSNKISIFESIGQGDQYFRTWEKEIHPILCEVALQPDQINQLFKSIEKSGGRSGLGKAVDAVKGAKDKISDVWFNKFGGMLQSSAPVQAFDQKWEDIKSKIAAKNPELANKLAKYGEFAKNNPRLHKFLLAIAGSAAAALGVAVAGGVGAGALAVGTGVGVATGIVNIADRLLQGQKASTAIGRGATTGAIAGITAGFMAKIGNWLGSIREKSIPFGPENAGLEKVSYGATRQLTAPGMSSTETIQGFNITVDQETASGIRSAMDLVRNGDPSGFRELKRLATMIRTPEYKEGIKAALGAAKEVAISNDSMMQWINGVTQLATSAAGGAASAGMASGGQQQPVKESLTRRQINELFGFTGNKIDASKLEKAWKKAGSPTDSEEVAKILQSAGVDSSIIDQAFTDLGIQRGAPQNSTANIDEINTFLATLKLDDLKNLQKLVNDTLAKSPA